MSEMFFEERRKMLMASSSGSAVTPEPGHDGRIWVYHTTTSASQTLRILSKTTSMGIGSTMIVDGVPTPISTGYTFSEAGTHLIQYEIANTVKGIFSGVAGVSEIYFPPTTVPIGSGSDSPFAGLGNFSIIKVPGQTTFPKFSAGVSVDASKTSTIELLNVSSWGASDTVSHNRITNFIIKGTFGSIPNSGLVGFNDTSGFKYIWIESPNLASIGSSFCMNMRNFQTLVLNVETPPTVNTSNLFYRTTSSSFKIYVPYSSDHSILNNWKAAAGWSTHASRFLELTQDGQIPT